MALAEDLPEGEPQKQVALLLVAQHMIDRLQEEIMAKENRLPFAPGTKQPRDNTSATLSLPRNVIDFYRPHDYGFELTCFSKHPLRVGSQHFNTAEHLYQFLKFELTAPHVADQIVQSKTPYKAKEIANQNRQLERQDWCRVKDSAMRTVCSIKAFQHPEVTEFLHTNYNAHLREGSRHDAYWGIGRHGTGRNQLGITWMNLARKIANRRNIGHYDISAIIVDELRQSHGAFVDASHALGNSSHSPKHETISLRHDLDIGVDSAERNPYRQIGYLSKEIVDAVRFLTFCESVTRLTQSSADERQSLYQKVSDLIDSQQSPDKLAEALTAVLRLSSAMVAVMKIEMLERGRQRSPKRNGLLYAQQRAGLERNIELVDSTSFSALENADFEVQFRKVKKSLINALERARDKVDTWLQE